MATVWDHVDVDVERGSKVTRFPHRTPEIVITDDKTRPSSGGLNRDVIGVNGCESYR